jgi:hypothetical protein
LRKVVFLHIQKTAGNTLHQILFNNRRGYVGLEYNQGERFNKHDLKRLKQKYPFQISGIGGHQLNCTDKNLIFGPKAFVFTILRDPIDRYLSFYNHMKARHDYPFSFDEYLKGEQQHNFQTKAIAKEANLEKAIDILKNQFDFVGDFAEMDKSIAILGGMLNLDTNQHRLNPSPKSGLRRSDLSEHQLAAAQSNNALDIELYDYAQKQLSQYPNIESSTKVSTFRKWLGKWLKKVSLFYVNKVVLKG